MGEDGKSFRGGLELNFFPDYELESPNDESSPAEKAKSLARNALRVLMMGWHYDWLELVSWPAFKAVFFQRDPDLLRAMRMAFQEGFIHLFHQLRVLDLNSAQKEQVQLYLSNCLSILPYSDLTPYECIAIPQFIDNKWVLVDYSVQPIELSPDPWLKRYFARDEDRVFAYGLEPINCRDAESHLIFMGTTYPAGQGFISQIHTDFEGYDTVGNSLYRNSRTRITKWLARQKNRTHVCGVSLGGSLSLLLAIDQGQYLSRVDAWNPPGLHDPWQQNIYDRWAKISVKPKVVIQMQANDPVSIFGEWKEDWEVIEVMPPSNKQGPNPFCDHFLNYAGFSETEFTHLNAKDENVKRKQRNFWLFTLGRNLIYYTIIAPYSFLVRPTLSKVNQSLQGKLGALTVFAILSALVVLVPLGLLSPPYLIGGACIVALGVFANFLLWPLVARWTNKKISQRDTENAPAKLHDPSLKRNSRLDLYSTETLIDCEFTAAEVHTYYKVMRCILKNKPLVADNDRSFKYQSQVSKNKLLIFCSDPKNASSVVKLKKTKAKIVHMRHTLSLVDELACAPVSSLKIALEEEYKYYCSGKL